ncbi:reverse transcriptase-like protein [Plakobranchus ocellatus]|uniref:Reverse transcriptase-like protein n=1 Tax=Plakobranchus ocellatus TaxID=259542 RepID=A0AAV4BH82_9GAST|nr:reverse transcriptase-like protein [Plakobranchus ocellatus]
MCTTGLAGDKNKREQRGSLVLRQCLCWLRERRVPLRDHAQFYRPLPREPRGQPYRQQGLMVCAISSLEPCLHILLKLFSNIWTTGDFHPSWREASEVPIPKPGKDPSDPSNYGPIALTTCLRKTLERMVNDRLVHVLSEVQRGFRKDQV